jgi:hypothetical protein
MKSLDEDGLAQPPEKPATLPTAPPAGPAAPPDEPARIVVQVAPEVSVGCAYCKGRLARPQAVYCAACLAPHHQDCWTSHGKCAACAADTLVRAERTPRPAKGAAVAAVAVATLALGAALLALPPSKAPTSVEAAHPAPAGTNLPAVPTQATPAPASARKSSGPDVGDTIRVRRARFRVTRLLPDGFVARQWLGDNWGDDSTISGDTLYAPIELVKKTTIESAGRPSVELTVEFFKQGPSSSAAVSVSLSEKSSVLRSALLQLPGQKPIELGPLLPGETRSERLEVDIGGPLGELKDVDLVPVDSTGAKRIIASRLARDVALELALAETAAANGDPQLALALADRLSGDDRRIVDRVFASFEGRGADALLEHLSVEDEHYGVMAPTLEGTLVWKPTSRAGAVQQREVELLGDLSCAVKGGRAFLLFQISRRKTLGRDELFDVAREHVHDLITEMATDPRFIEGDNEDAAAAFLAGLGPQACAYLSARVTPLDAEIGRAIGGRESFEVLEPVKKGLALLRRDLSSRRQKP